MSNPDKTAPHKKSALAEAFEPASHETPKVKAALEAASKAAVKLDEVDLSHVFNPAEKS